MTILRLLAATLYASSLLLGIFDMTHAQAASESNDVAPIAIKKAWQETRHGEVVTDDYRWLQQKDHPEVIAHLNAENAYTESHTAKLHPFADKLFTEIKGRLQEVNFSVPVRRGLFYYYTRTVAGEQYPVYCRRAADARLAYDASAPEQVLLDQNALAKGQKFFAVGLMMISPDGKILAYTTDTIGYRQYQLHLLDIKSGQLLADSAERVTSLAWAADSHTLFYVQEDPVTKRSERLFRKSIGGKPIQIAQEKIEQFDLQVDTTHDMAFIRLTSRATDTSEVSLLSTLQPNGKFRSILGRKQGHRYMVEHRADQLIITTNQQAKNFRVVTAPIATPSAHHWHELVATDKDVLIFDTEVFANYMVLHEKTLALNRFRIYNFASKQWRTVQFDDPVYLARSVFTPEFSSEHMRLNYQSPVRPSTIMDIEMANGNRQILKQQEIPGGYDASRYESQRLWATAPDGVRVPLWAVYKKGVKFDGNAPLLLYSYGSYGISTEANFSINRISLLERGVIYVQAHIRGGTDLGEHWHEDGMLMHKKNTFTDFIASAEYLIKEKWTRPERLIIQGRSAGGLLMGAVVNMRPDLFHAVHAGVPFVDVMNTMLNASLPLTTGEYREWGNPNEKAAYDYMRSYSPYDNITNKAYPAMLVTTSLNDSQVMYWEPAKYVAKLRAHKTDTNPLLLKVNMAAGHGGASGRYEAIKEDAFILAWMLSQWGIEQ